jgi:fatty acid desaturase
VATLPSTAACLAQEWTEMSKALFALERRLEVRGLYVFFVCLLGLAAFGVLHGDWWLLAICFVASSLNGMIGQGLQKNRQKSFKQLAARSDLGEAQTADKPGSIDFHIVARSATRFMALIALVGAVVAYHFDEPLWRVIATGVIAWLVAALLILSIFYKAQTQTLDKSLVR